MQAHSTPDVQETRSCGRSSNPYFCNLRTEDLLQLEESVKWDRLYYEHESKDASALRDAAIALIDLDLQDIRLELAFRERMRHYSSAPSWPAAPSAERERFKDEIRERITVRDLFERYFPANRLRRSGKEWRTFCPLHGGSNPDAFSIRHSDRGWCCFGECGRSGDVFTLAGIIFRTTNFGEILDRLGQEFGIDQPPKIIPPDPDTYRAGGTMRGRIKPAKPRYADYVGGKVVSQ